MLKTNSWIIKNTLQAIYDLYKVVITIKGL